MVIKDECAAAVPFFQRAIRLDPNFAMAYAALGSSFENLGETTLGEEKVRKAYDLRSRVSEQEKFYIESSYYHYATGDREKARQLYELWEQTYPRYAGTPLRLYVLYSELGQYENALREIRQSLRLDPARSVSYSDLVLNYLNLNHPNEAQATAEDAQDKKHDSFGLRFNLYLLAFLENDAEGMLRQVEWAADKPAKEDALLELEADTAAYFGRLRKSRDLSRRAVASAMQTEKRERAAGYEASAALREALYGNMIEARLRGTSAHTASAGIDVQYGAALGLAFAGDSARAQVVADEIAKSRPDDTIVKFNYLPTIRAQLAVNRRHPSEAIEALQAAAPYEFGSPGSVGFWSSLYPAYVRGEAYLALHEGPEAAAEFQKILDHRGVVLNQLIGALAHLQLGRAYAIQGDTAKAKAAYQEFLVLWKGADAGIPILKQAQAEFAKLN
jgi:Flp pilus assembly protein TadD